MSELARHLDADVLVIGTGIAGLSTAISLSGAKRTLVLSKEEDGGGSTKLAQGGIAAALAPGDSAEAHAADTVAAAAGLGDPRVAEAVTAEAVEAVGELARLGVHFDSGALSREGGHSCARVAHAHGDATGAEISRALMAAAAERGVAIVSGMFLVDLLTTSDGTGVSGALVWDSRAGTLRALYADNVVVATGGYGQLWACTTSSVACNGDGLAAALRAGAQVADLEMVQFHPTGMDLGLDPRPLASEALRGAGARLRDASGEYLNGPGGTGDLAPRDVVSRSMARRMAELGADHGFLDATSLGAGLAGHFPTFVQMCAAAGLDPLRQWVPVAPTTHYTMGGVLTDTDGRTTLEGLLAIGEVASSGLHGANRLASNSLLEGAVMARRAAAVIVAEGGPVTPRLPVTTIEPLALLPMGEPDDSPFDRSGLRRAMQANAGVSRDAEGLGLLAAYLAAGPVPGPQPGVADQYELQNMSLLARVLVALALRRQESRGAHWRTDFPEPRPEWCVRQVVHMAPNHEFSVGNLEVPAAVPAVTTPA